MRTYPNPGEGGARALRHLGALVCILASASIAQAQDRRNLLEIGAAGAYQSFSNVTGLDGTAGGLARLGVWLPLNLSVEAEGSVSNSNTIGIKTGSVSLLYNLPLGSSSWGYAKAGVGGTRYGATGSECLQPKYVGR